MKNNMTGDSAEYDPLFNSSQPMTKHFEIDHEDSMSLFKKIDTNGNQELDDQSDNQGDSQSGYQSNIQDNNKGNNPSYVLMNTKSKSN